MTHLETAVLRATRAELAEGPTWDAATKRLWWVDILAGHIWLESLSDPDASTMIALDGHVGAAMPCGEPDRLLLLLRDGFHLLDGLGADGELRPLARPIADQPALRFNDGKVGPGGHAFGGTMPYDRGGPTGALYRLDGCSGVTRLGTMALSNGMGWSPDGHRMYVVDSEPGIVLQYRYDDTTGDLSERRLFLEIPVAAGMPDGLTVDNEGCVWLALWGGHAVHRYTPDGRLDRIVPLPVSQPTSVCFAGPDLATLVVTTATYGLDRRTLSREPLAGALFAVDAHVTGPAATPWRPTFPKES